MMTPSTSSYPHKEAKPFLQNREEISMAGGTMSFSPKKIQELKREYIKALSFPFDRGTFDYPSHDLNVFLPLSLDKLQALYLNLRNLFTEVCLNQERINIINSLLGAPEDQWPVIIKQVCFIMPFGTRGHDVMWATQILASIPNSSDRERLIHTANRLFKYDTLTTERGYILAALAKKSVEELSNLDKADEIERDVFIKIVVPGSIKEGSKIVCTYDHILEESWKV